MVRLARPHAFGRHGRVANSDRFSGRPRSSDGLSTLANGKGRLRRLCENEVLQAGVPRLFLLGSGEPCPEIGPAERHYSNGCTGGRDDAPVFGLVAGFKEPPSGLVTEPFCGRGGIGLPEMPGRGYVGGLLGAGGPPADSGSVADGSCRCAEEFVVVDKVAAIIVAASREMIFFFTCISLEASLKGGAFSQSLLALGACRT